MREVFAKPVRCKVGIDVVDSRPEDKVHGASLFSESEIFLPVTGHDGAYLNHHPVSLAGHPGGTSHIARCESIVGVGEFVGFHIPGEHVHARIVESLQLLDKVAV